jgi:YhcH/YjgK/YiaL family protein
MILAPLAHADRYADLHPRFAAALDFLRRADLASLDVGRHEIDGDGLFAIVDRAAARPRDQAPLEAHRKYVDIQYVIVGREEMGWKSRGDCTDVREAYDAQRDLEFFAGAPSTWLTVAAGSLAIFFPEDAHAPLAGEGEIHKVVVKVAM